MNTTPELSNALGELAGTKALVDRFLEALASSQSYDTFRYRMLNGNTWVEIPDDAIPKGSEGYLIYYTNNFDKEDFMRNDDGTAAIIKTRDEAEWLLKKYEDICSPLGGSNFRIKEIF